MEFWPFVLNFVGLCRVKVIDFTSGLARVKPKQPATAKDSKIQDVSFFEGCVYEKSRMPVFMALHVNAFLFFQRIGENKRAHTHILFCEWQNRLPSPALKKDMFSEEGQACLNHLAWARLFWSNRVEIEQQLEQAAK